MKTDTPKRILVVDDEPDVTDLLAYRLRQMGYRVAAVNDALKVVPEIRRFRPDALVLDIMMPKFNGLQLCMLLRADPETKDLPILFLTALGETSDRIKGFESGADDYLSKPFDARELGLRVAALLRRGGSKTVGAPQSSPPLVLKKLTLDRERHRVVAAGIPVELTATEFRLLELLMERKGRVQTREGLLKSVWNYETDVETRTVDTHIRRLRDKLGECGSYVETVRGVGYRIVE